MANTELQTIIEDAINQVDTYKHPQLDEFKTAIKPILKAYLGRSFADHDDITSIDIYNGELRICTEYYVRSCHQTDDFEIPMEIINSDNPIKTATEYHLKLEVENLKTNLDRQNSLATIAKTKYEEAVKKYDDFNRG